MPISEKTLKDGNRTPKQREAMKNVKKNAQRAKEEGRVRKYKKMVFNPLDEKTKAERNAKRAAAGLDHQAPRQKNKIIDAKEKARVDTKKAVAEWNKKSVDADGVKKRRTFKLETDKSYSRSRLKQEGRRAKTGPSRSTLEARYQEEYKAEQRAAEKRAAEKKAQRHVRKKAAAMTVAKKQKGFVTKALGKVAGKAVGGAGTAAVVGHELYKSGKKSVAKARQRRKDDISGKSPVRKRPATGMAKKPRAR